MDDFETVQAALVGLIKAVSTEAGQGVYDLVPRDNAGGLLVEFPYVAIGDGQELSDDVSCQEGIDEYVDIHIWSLGPGKPQTRRIGDGIRAALHGQSLPVAGKSACTAWVRGIRIFEDEDEVTYHGVVTVRILHQKG